MTLAQTYSDYVNTSLSLIAKGEFEKLSQEDINTIYGSIMVLAGWINPIRPGSQVIVEINGKETICEIIEGGFNSGKNLTSIIIVGDPARIV